MTGNQKNTVRITLPDAVTLAALAGVVGYVLYRAVVGLNYHWHWEAIPQYLIRYDGVNHVWKPGLLTQGLMTTLRLSLWSGVLAMIAGLVMGLFRVSPSLFKRQLAGTYVGLIRNTPPLVLIFIFYFFIGDQIMALLHVENLMAGLSETMRNALSWPFGP